MIPVDGLGESRRRYKTFPSPQKVLWGNLFSIGPGIIWAPSGSEMNGGLPFQRESQTSVIPATRHP